MTLRNKVRLLVDDITKRMKREKNIPKKWRMKIIKDELSKLADEL